MIQSAGLAHKGGDVLWVSSQVSALSALRGQVYSAVYVNTSDLIFYRSMGDQAEQAEHSLKAVTLEQNYPPSQLGGPVREGNFLEGLLLAQLPNEVANNLPLVALSG